MRRIDARTFPQAGVGRRGSRIDLQQKGTGLREHEVRTEEPAESGNGTHDAARHVGKGAVGVVECGDAHAVEPQLPRKLDDMLPIHGKHPRVPPVRDNGKARGLAFDEGLEHEAGRVALPGIPRIVEFLKDEGIETSAAVIGFHDPASLILEGDPAVEARHARNPRKRADSGGFPLARQNTHRSATRTEHGTPRCLGVPGEALQHTAGLRRDEPHGIDTRERFGQRPVEVARRNRHRVPAGARALRKSRIVGHPYLDTGNRFEVCNKGLTHEQALAGQRSRRHRPCQPSAGNMLVDQNPHRRSPVTPIPVLDLMHGTVVRAQRGDRDTYRPLLTGRVPSSEPVAVVRSLLDLAPFPMVYVADLDAIRGEGHHRADVQRIKTAFPALSVWVDAGFSSTAVLDPWRDLQIVPVIGTETLASAEALDAVLRAWPDAILSLDSRGAERRGPAALFEQPQRWPDRVIVMTLERVGSYEGPAHEALKQFKRLSPRTKFIAAGGVRNAQDLEWLENLGVEAALVASAIADGRLDAGTLARYLPAAAG